MKILKIVLSVLFTLPLSFGINENFKNLSPPPKLRIVGGIDAEPNSAPFIVSLLIRNRLRQLKPYCAGTILNENWILTAAHCLVIDPERIIVAAGHNNAAKFDEATQFRKADYHIQHDDFDNIGPSDIGLLHVNEPFIYSPQIQRVTLSSNDSKVEKDEIATIYGWGSILASRTRQFPSILQTANLTIVDNSYCDSVFPIEIDDGNLCAGLPAGGKGGCVGDSGGPLMINNVQIGITSWGPVTCDPSEGPSVFTRISYYIPWIEENLKIKPGEKTEESGEDDDGDEENDDLYEIGGNEIIRDVVTDDNDEYIEIGDEKLSEEKDDETNKNDIVNYYDDLGISNYPIKNKANIKKK